MSVPFAGKEGTGRRALGQLLSPDVLCFTLEVSFYASHRDGVGLVPYTRSGYVELGRYGFGNGGDSNFDSFAFWRQTTETLLSEFCFPRTHDRWVWVLVYVLLCVILPLSNPSSANIFYRLVLKQSILSYFIERCFLPQGEKRKNIIFFCLLLVLSYVLYLFWSSCLFFPPFRPFLLVCFVLSTFCIILLFWPSQMIHGAPFGRYLSLFVYSTVGGWPSKPFLQQFFFSFFSPSRAMLCLVCDNGPDKILAMG